MITQLLLSKRLYICGCSYVDSPDPISTGMAISLFQDSIEVFCWSLLKKLDANPNEKSPFTSYFDLVEKATKNNESKKLPFKAKIIELNKARVNFKHYGILPDMSEASKFQGYTEEFLRVSFTEFFNTDFDNISLSELIPFKDIREVIISSEKAFSEDRLDDCSCDLAKANSMLLGKFSKFLPEVDCHLRDADNIFATRDNVYNVYGVHIFRYLSDYLKAFRHVNFLALCGVSMKEYLLMEQYLPCTYQTADGKWHFKRTNTNKATKDILLKIKNCIINLSLKLNQIIS